MSDMGSKEYLRLVADCILELEAGLDCIGATSYHIEQLLNSVTRDVNPNLMLFADALDESTEQAETHQEFDAICAGLLGGE